MSQTKQPGHAFKAWKRSSLWEWLKARANAKQVFKGDAALECETLESLTTKQLEFCLFVATLAYAKGYRDSTEGHKS